MRIFAVAYLLIYTSIVMLGQDGSEPPELVTDRPDKTESSSVVPKHSLQLEAGFHYAVSTSNIEKEWDIGYTDALLRFGLLERMELRFGFSYAKISTETLATGNIDDLNGFAPVMPGLKFSITEENGWIPELALLTHLYIPFKNSEITQANISADLILAASHTLSSRIGIGCNLGVAWGINDHNPTGSYSLVAGFGLSKKTGAFIETFGEFESDLFSNSIDGGFTFLILPNLQLDLSGAIGLTESAPDYYLGGGFSFRLPQ